jgi:hypothetical protein
LSPLKVFKDIKDVKDLKDVNASSPKQSHLSKGEVKTGLGEGAGHPHGEESVKQKVV